jgi:putative membrane protein
MTESKEQPPPRDYKRRSLVGRIIPSRGASEACILDVEQPVQVRGDEELSRYAAYPLVQDMLKYEKTREACFHCDGFDQYVYPKGNDGWMKTLCTIRGRALQNIAVPWFVVTLNSVGVILMFELGGFSKEDIEEAVGDWATFYGLILNFVLSFLLVFRLNRAAARYWEARKCWGVMIAVGRSMTSGLLCHGGHSPIVRDEAIRWTAATAVSVLAFMRGDNVLPTHILDGILDEADVELMQSAKHMPIYASDRIRDALQRLFSVTAETPTSLAHSWTVQRDLLEQELNTYTRQYGAMERIRATPLPIVYVAHLRTFLLLHLMLFPYVFGPQQHWATIPLTMITAFAFLGIEGASMEVENPFKKDHVNNLNMDALASALIQNIQQQVQCKADLEISRLSPTLSK